MIAALALALAASPAPVVFGPPALCHPIRIGSAHSLPWNGKGGFDRKPGYGGEAVLRDVWKVLDGTSDALVTAETARRAVVYVREWGESEKERSGTAYSLVETLRKRASILEAELARGEATARERGLAWLAVGFAQASLFQGGTIVGDRGEEALELAGELLAGDGGFHFARALATWEDGPDPRAYLRDFQRALEVGSGCELLAANLDACAQRFFHASDRHALARIVAERLD